MEKLNCIENMLISNKSQEKGLLSVFSKIPPELTDKAEKFIKICWFISKEKN